MYSVKQKQKRNLFTLYTAAGEMLSPPPLLSPAAFFIAESATMRKTAIATIILAGAWSICFAYDSINPLRVSSPETLKVNFTTGEVRSVSLADPGKGMRSEIILAAESGQQCIMLVKATTTIYDATGKPITLSTIKKGDKIKTKYITTGEGVNETLSIRLLKQ